MRGRRLQWCAYLFLAPYLALALLFLLLPLGYGLVLSFCRWQMLSMQPARWVGLANYREALSDSYFWQAAWATVRFVLLTAPAIVALALVVALGLHRLPRGRQTLYRSLYFLPTLITVSVAGILWRWMLDDNFGLFNAFLARFGVQIPWLSDARWAMPSIALMTIWWTLGGPMLVLLAGLQEIPAQYLEAAELDGASGWQILRRVQIPLLRPVLLFVLVLNVIGAFQVFGQTFVMTRGGPNLSTRVLVQYIYETAFESYRMGYAAALSWLLFLLIAACSLAQARLMGFGRRGG